MNTFLTPKEIETESMRRIAVGLQERGITIPEELQPVVYRAIHTTADFDYADNLFFSTDVIRKAKAALQDGCDIVTDTNMALTGISKVSCAKHGVQVHCYMADDEIAAKAKEEGTTRAYAAMTHAAKLFPSGIFVSGNAPTALIRLVELMEETDFRPRLVVGVPVGFVNVVESKELLQQTCLKYNIPCIIAMGQKGGSNVAAAIINALLYSL
ncbi:MAG: precorrin-8X methylmutase [Lachnospiraceae bacterium]|nr:precorrin-8X methylmutase [Lachnospiraceae bacterium]